MKYTTEIKVSPVVYSDMEQVRHVLANKLNLDVNDITHLALERRSIDARGKSPKYVLRYHVYVNEVPAPAKRITSQWTPVDEKPEVVIIGAGPAGYFAALKAIELGVKPIIFDRGKDVRARRRDLRAIQQFDTVDPDSNYCFGEGGAGTYSDGKLYTRSVKRGKISEILQLLVEHGAPTDILVDSHPHIGSNKLPKIVAKIRETIEHFGGEIHFGSRLTDLVIRDGILRRIVINADREIEVTALILATGHSARDIYKMLHEKDILIEAKPFALGVRIEHPQPLIDQIQYNQKKRDALLPASSYRLTCQVGGKGVFSFCMCPGGLIVPTATAPGEIVVNGMSLSRRDSPYANSGTVVSIEPEDLKPMGYEGIFACMDFQRDVERTMFEAGDGGQQAPAQRLIDFAEGRNSSDLPDSSYIPGLLNASVHDLLPKFIRNHLQSGIRQFGHKMRGYYTNDAVVVGTESRTSAPVRIPRDRETCMHLEVRGLFPCGEGAGYAGGILSAAMDGQRVAKAVATFLK